MIAPDDVGMYNTCASTTIGCGGNMHADGMNCVGKIIGIASLSMRGGGLLNYDDKFVVIDRSAFR